jgi:hypothetical protein
MKQGEQGNVSEAELLRRLDALPRRVAPRSDPWPAILDRIKAEDVRRPRSAPGWFKVAAAVALAFALGMFLGNGVQFPPYQGAVTEQLVQENDRAGPTPNYGGALAGAERVYQAAFSEFITIGHSSTELKPATLDAIERDWHEMLDAEAALAAALQQYPDNPWLNQRMLELRERQLAMLKQLAGLDRASRRTQI